MNRRDFCALTAGALFASKLSQGETESQERNASLRFTNKRTGEGPFHSLGKDKRPHIFLISVDMVSPDLYHPDRPLSKIVKIPNIRALMQEGKFFSNAFCTVPLCAPSRASYLTGRYSYIQGNGERAPEGLETQLRPTDIIFPEYLHASGYVTRQVGKCHVGTKKFLDAFGENDHPWDRWSPPVFDDDEFLAYQSSLGVKQQKYSREITFKLQDRSTHGDSTGGWIVQSDGKPFPLEAQYSYFLAHKAKETLRGLVNEGVTARRPLYMQLDFFDPHQPFSIPAGFEEREKELRKMVKLPDSYYRAKKADWRRAEDEPEIVDVYRRYWGIYDEQALLDYRVAYILQMELVDHVVGLFLQQLKDLGLYDESVVALISDHGEMNGRRALVDKGVYLYPDVLRVPMVIKMPKAMEVKPGVVSTTTSLLDLSQTLLDIAGIEPEGKFDGVSLLPLIREEKQLGERTLLFFGGWHVGVNFACGIEHRRADGGHFLYSYNCTSPVDELYDLNSDDAVNLIDDSRYRETRDEMIRRMGVILQSDPRWTGYWSEFRVARFASLPKTKGDMQLFTGSE